MARRGASGAATAESRRLDEAREAGVPWRRWGPYLSERQWGTVREDTSQDGNAWASFPYEHAAWRAYRWGEDGLAGWCDDKQRLCLALALWNGKDSHLKERLFGLSNGQGNHGEDVKEYYWYVDGVPTNAYLRFLYRYPHAAFPYEDLVRTNAERGRAGFEYELIDTGVLREDRYFDVEVEYAKEDPETVLARITVTNRGPEAARVHVLPTLWFRNTWWDDPKSPRPVLRGGEGTKGVATVAATHADLGDRVLRVEGDLPLLFTDNETNPRRAGGGGAGARYAKDGIHEAVVHGKADAVNPAALGTKAAAHATWDVGPGESRTLRLSLAPATGRPTPFGRAFDEAVAARRAEADAFYAAVLPPSLSDDARLVARQAYAGMVWSKQYYGYDLNRWLAERGAPATDPSAKAGLRNRHWFHMVNDDVVSMPDKWEYPWYAAWDLAFHATVFTRIDLDFAKSQIELLLGDLYLHPNGQLPAYEWNFGDVNPPVHAWAAVVVHYAEQAARGRADVGFLRRVFAKLLVNFTWWVNRKDPGGRNVFEGGFLGLDNIGVFDRSAPLPAGGSLEQADATAWMAFYCQTMLELAIALGREDPTYEDLALKFVQHFFWIAAAMDGFGGRRTGMWDEEDGFFYDLLRHADGTSERLKVRSLVGILPLCAVTVYEQDLEVKFPHLLGRVQAFAARHPEVVQAVAPPGRAGVGGRRMLAAVGEEKLRRILARLLDESEFLGPYGLRSLSRHHAEHPYEHTVDGQPLRVAYEPAESSSGMFGGNSNWRGPVWLPMNLLIVRALLQYYSFYGDEFRVECPTGSGKKATLFEVAQEVTRRLTRIFLRDEKGRRAVFGGVETFQSDPHWRDLVPFYEYFHGDIGAGIGASHQTGWTGVVALLLQSLEVGDARTVLSHGARAALSGRP